MTKASKDVEKVTDLEIERTTDKEASEQTRKEEGKTDSGKDSDFEENETLKKQDADMDKIFDYSPTLTFLGSSKPNSISDPENGPKNMDDEMKQKEKFGEERHHPAPALYPPKREELSSEKEGIRVENSPEGLKKQDTKRDGKLSPASLQGSSKPNAVSEPEKDKQCSPRVDMDITKEMEKQRRLNFLRPASLPTYVRRKDRLVAVDGREIEKSAPAPLQGSFKPNAVSEPEKDKQCSPRVDMDTTKEIEKQRLLNFLRPESLPNYVRRKDRPVTVDGVEIEAIAERQNTHDNAKDSPRDDMDLEKTRKGEVCMGLELAPGLASERLESPPAATYDVNQGEKAEEAKEEVKAPLVGAFLTRPGGHAVPADRRPFESIIREQNDFEHDFIEKNDSDPTIRKNEGILIEAHAVEDPVLVTAKPETFFRRHQWWIVGGGIAALMIIIAVVVFATVDFSGSKEPTDAPTTIEEGIEEKVKELIIDQIPGAETALLNEELPQYKALQWIVDKRYSGGESWYTDKRILSQYSLATLLLSTATKSTSSSWHNIGRFLNKTEHESASSAWYIYDNWMETDNECDWHGISCDETGQIVGLNLTGNNLKGTIPADIGLLSSLASLDLNGNFLSGSIPTELFKLTKLSTLNLAQNTITGQIPALISQATDLSLLDLSDNNLSSLLPLEIGELSILKIMKLANNALIGSVPSQIGNLVLLRDLDIRNNSLTYELPTEIGRLSSLSRLYLQENKLLGPLPSEIGLLSSLQAWNMSSNNVFDKLPKTLWQGGSLRNLESLDLSHNLLTGDEYDFEFFGDSWKKLTSLRLGRNFLRGNSGDSYSLPKAISHKLKSLTAIDISSNFFVGTVPDEFLWIGSLEVLKLGNSGLKFQDKPEEVLSQITSNLLSLVELDLTKCGVEGSIPTQIGMLKNLESIQLSLNSLNGIIPSQLGLLTALTDIRLDINQLSGSIPHRLFALNNLTSINFASNELIGTLSPQIGSLSNLKVIELQYNKLTGVIPSQIGMLSNLDILWLDSNQFNGTIPSEIGIIDNARQVYLWDNLLTGTIPTQVGLLSKFGRLKKLWFHRNNLNGTIPTQIGMLKSLESLHLYSNILTGTIPSQIGKLTKLMYIFLNNNDLTGTIPTEIGNINEWKIINLHYNSLTGMIPSYFGNVESFETLNLTGNELFGSIPLSFCKMEPRPKITVDCNNVTCFCCGCDGYTPTASPFPSVSPSLSDQPSITPIPSLLPSSSQTPTLKTVVITFEIQFDQFPSDTGWKIIDLNDGIIDGIPSGTYSDSEENKNAVVKDQISLALGHNFTFQILDSHGDGLKGRVTIYLGDTPDMNNILGSYINEGKEFKTYDILFQASKDGIIETNF